MIKHFVLIVFPVLIMSHTCFSVNLHPVVAWMFRNFLLETGVISNLSDCNGTWTHNHLVCKWAPNHLVKLAKWLSRQPFSQTDQVIELYDEYFYLYGALSVWTVCHYNVQFTFQSESALYSWLNVKELLARSRCSIWTLSDCNGTQTQNHLFCKETLNHLAKLVWKNLLLPQNHLLISLTEGTHAMPVTSCKHWVLYLYSGECLVRNLHNCLHYWSQLH